MRIDKDVWGLYLAKVSSLLSTCSRRSVGCVLVDKRGHILSTGRNGVASGMPHCEGEAKCAGADATSGQSLDFCDAIHAEINALIQCKFPHEIHTCYSTTAPCIHCIKALMNTSCYRVVFFEKYPHPRSKELWEQNGREWVYFPRIKEQFDQIDLSVLEAWNGSTFDR